MSEAISSRKAAPPVGAWRKVNDAGVVFTRPRGTSPYGDTGLDRLSDPTAAFMPGEVRVMLDWLERWTCILEARRNAMEHTTVTECDEQLDHLATFRPALDARKADEPGLLDCRTAWRYTMARRTELEKKGG